MSDPQKEALVQMQLETGSVIQGEEDRKAIVDYLTSEISDVYFGVERQQMAAKWRKWRRQREARPESDSKSFPWENASNVAVPMAMYNTNGIYALLKSSVGAKKPFFGISTEDQMYSRQATALELFVNALVESRYHLNLRAANNVILYETGSMGTQFIKVPWVIDRWDFKRRGAAGTEQVSKIVRDTPVVVPMRIDDFGTRSNWPDLQRAPWISERATLYEHELQQRAAQGVYTDIEQVLARGPDTLGEERLETLARMGIQPTVVDSKMYEIYEVNLFWDVDGDGIAEDVVIWFDLTSGTILRSEWNELGIRNTVRIPYFNRPGELYAVGVGWMTEHIQDEIDALHNMRVDGTMLGMLQMYVTKRGGPFGVDEEFRPLKNIPADVPRDDFIPIKFPDLGPGTIQAELLAKEYADRVTGASDAMMGYESRSTSARTTATGTMFLAQQGNKMFGAVRECVEEGYSELAQVIGFQLVRNKQRALEMRNLIPADYWADLEQALSIEVEDIPSRFRFRVQIADIEQTEEAKKQSKLTLTQLYTMYGREVFQILPMVYNPQVPPQIREVATKFFIGATKLMDSVFEGFGERDSSDYLPYVRDIEMMVEQIEAMKDQRLQGGNRATQRAITTAPVTQMGPSTPPTGGATGPYGGPSTGGPETTGEESPATEEE